MKEFAFRNFIFGLLGAAIGGCLGYYAFFWIAKQGFYALAIPGASLGLGAGLCARSRSWVLAAFCAVAALGLGLCIEWRYSPFTADRSFAYFLRHVHLLQPLTLIMLGIGTVVGGWLALGRDRGAEI